MRRLINVDETHHKKATGSAKGGPKTKTVTNSDLPRPGARFCKDNGDHVSGCYGASVIEPMPPVVIYKSAAKDAKKRKVKPSWVKNLPRVVGQWGFDLKGWVDSHFASRPNGSMDEDLYMQTVSFFASCYPDLAPKFLWDGDDVIEGPIMLKSDSGIGRNCKSVRAVKFRRKMHMRGCLQLPGLPNSTSVSQEMDQLYTGFKGKTDDRAEEIFERKTFERAKVLEKRHTTPDIQVPVAHLTNDDIPEMINGRPGDPLEKRPFDLMFSQQNIVRSWLKVGFVPFTRAALTHPKVRHTLGEGGASAEMHEKMMAVKEEYGALKTKVKERGLNDFVFNAKLPVARKNEFLEKTEKHQIKALVENKGAFSARAQWCHVGVQLLGSEAVATAQLEQLTMEQEKAKKAAAKKATDKEKKILKARAALEVFKDEKRKAGKDDYKDVVMFLVPRLDKDTAPSKVASMKKAKEKLAELASKYNKPWIQLVEDEMEKCVRR